MKTFHNLQLVPSAEPYVGLLAGRNKSKGITCLLKTVSVLVLFFGIMNGVNGAGITITGTTSWSAITTGTGPGGTPGPADDITITPNSSATILTIDFGGTNTGTTPHCKSITVNGGNNAGKTATVTFSGTGSLYVYGALTLGNSGTGACAMTMTSTATLFAHSFAQGATTSTWTINTGTIDFTGTSFTLPAGAAAFNTLNIDSNIVTLAAASTTGALKVGTGATLAGSTFTLDISGNLIVNGTLSGSGIITLSGASATIDGSGSITNTNTVSISANHTINSAANLNISSIIAIANSIIVSNNGIIISTNTSGITGGNSSSTWNNTGSTSSLSVLGTFLTVGAFTGITGNTVIYTASYNNYIVKPATYSNLTIASSGTTSQTLASATTVNGTLSLTSSTFATGTNLTMGTGATIAETGGTVTGTLSGTYSINFSGTNHVSSAATFGSNVQNVTVNMTAGNTLTLGVGFTCTGNLLISSGTLDDGNGSFTMNVGGNFTNNAAFTSHAGSTVVLNGSGAQTIGGTSTIAFANLTINNTTAAVATTTNISATGTITVNANATLNPGSTNTVGGTLVDNGTIKVTKSGNLSTQYTGTLTLTGGTVVMAGSAAQQIGALTFKNLTISNANDVVLSGAPTINGVLTLSAGNGNVLLGSNKLTIANTGSITGSSATSFIKTNGTGPLEMTTSGNTFFPVGDPYNPIFINPTTNAVFDVVVSTGISDQAGAAITTHGVGVQWAVTLISGATQNITLTPQWSASDELSLFLRSSSYVTYRTTNNTGIWNQTAAAAAAAGPGPYTQTSGIISMANGTTYYTSVGDINASALPVTLMSFTAKLESGRVDLKWATASESNNAFFEIQRSSDGKNWTSMAKVAGHVNSRSINTYSASDNSPLAGMSYYRLSQTDLNDAVETFPMISINNIVSTLDFNVTSANPTIFRSGFTLNYTVPFNGNVRVVIINMSGNIMKDITKFADSGKNALEINNTDAWRNGIYYVQVYYNNSVKVIKVTK
jgi:hypothetical protein